MHPDNRFYGHDMILADYCRTEASPLFGHLQHGWGPATGYSQFPMRLVRSLPLLVWSEHNAACCRKEFGGDVRRVGAPFGYLLSAVGTPPLPAQPSTLWFPAHGWEGHAITADYGRLIRSIRERENNPVTVCLYWHEFEQAAIRRQFVDAGFRVVCNGRRHDPGFLLRFRDELRLHHRVVANNVGTPIWYGGLAGREIEVYGPRFGFGDEAAAVAERDEECKRWPELHGGPIPPAKAYELAAVELGCDRLLAPDDLAVCVGWDGSVRRLAHLAARLEHHARRAVVNIGIRARLTGFR